ncbi:MAG: GNAT family N-acetyltransferase [Chloroflexi bacterium]|nr:GNAT family N-acetyltransferase [Chloroflexota bacterium]
MTLIETRLGPVAIVKARPDQLPLVMALLDAAAAWLEARHIRQWLWPHSPEFREYVARRIGEGEVYLAFRQVDGAAVGTLRFEWSEPLLWPADPDGAGYLHGLAIDPRLHGHRLGEALIEWAKGHVQAQGRSRLRLDCVAWNQRLRAYYESLGFMYCGERPEDAENKAALYELQLGENQAIPARLQAI